MSECIACSTLKMSYNSRRPYWVSLLRFHFAWAHQNGIIEDYKNIAWSDDSLYLLLHLDGRGRTGINYMKTWMRPALYQWLRLLLVVSCIIYTQMSMNPLADHTDLLITTAFPSIDGCFEQDNTPCQTASSVSRS